METPNCIGTALFIAGVGKFDYPYHGYEFELNEHMKSDKVEKEDLLGMMLPHYERRVTGALIFSYCAESDNWHAGIYLGIIGGEHCSFAQHGKREKFGIESINRNYSSPDYYIPITLLPLISSNICA